MNILIATATGFKGCFLTRQLWPAHKPLLFSGYLKLIANQFTVDNFKVIQKLPTILSFILPAIVRLKFAVAVGEA